MNPPDPRRSPPAAPGLIVAAGPADASSLPSASPPLFDRSKTLVQLKREKFKDPFWDFIPFPSGFHLRRVPLNNLTETDMWVLIRQSIGLDYLVWMALDRLELDPMVKCRQRPGDLLSAVLLADALVWKRNPHYRTRVLAIWKKVSVRLLANQHPEAKLLFSDYRWFLKTVDFLPPG